MSKEQIIIPLDVSTKEEAVELVKSLKDSVGVFKVGLELINNCGFEIFNLIKEAGAQKIFYDCKFMDIPNTVAGASTGATNQGVWMFNVHALGGLKMMQAARRATDETAARLNIAPPLVLAVTILTSIDKETLNNDLRIDGEVESQVVHLAKLAKAAGMDGVVASPLEIKAIRKAVGDNFIIVTPGVRPAGSDIGDQKRVMTPKEAIDSGADYLVIGRPITKAESPQKAANNIANMIS